MYEKKLIYFISLLKKWKREQRRERDTPTTITINLLL